MKVHSYLGIGTFACMLLCVPSLMAQNREEVVTEEELSSTPFTELIIVEEDEEPAYRNFSESSEQGQLDIKAVQQATNAVVMPPNSTSKPERSMVFEHVEEKPEFPGGQAAMFRWINQNMQYPLIAKENGVQGKVVVKFVVETDGTISEPKILRSLDNSLSAEALRLIMYMPKWRPGKNNGIAVPAYYLLPISFKLQQ